MGAGAGATLKPTWNGGDFPWAVESLGRTTWRAGRRQGAGAVAAVVAGAAAVVAAGSEVKAFGPADTAKPRASMEPVARILIASSLSISCDERRVNNASRQERSRSPGV